MSETNTNPPGLPPADPPGAAASDGPSPGGSPSAGGLPGLDNLARTIWGEARGQGIVGMLAVACVIRNRVIKGGWWGSDYDTVCTKPWQFSCWNENDPNRAKLLAADENTPRFADAMNIARAILTYPIPDISEGADSYYDNSIAPPDWTVGSTKTTAFATFIFYRTR